MSKTPQRRKRRTINNKSKRTINSNSTIRLLSYWSIFAVIFTLLILLKPAAEVTILKLSCYKHKDNENEFKTIYNVLNNNHKYSGDKEMKKTVLDVLADDVRWYDAVGHNGYLDSSSGYCEFYFGGKPTLDTINASSQSYRVDFTAVHRYRKRRSFSFIEIEQTTVYFKKKKIKSIQPSPEEYNPIITLVKVIYIYYLLIFPVSIFSSYFIINLIEKTTIKDILPFLGGA